MTSFIGLVHGTREDTTRALSILILRTKKMLEDLISEILGSTGCTILQIIDPEHLEESILHLMEESVLLIEEELLQRIAYFLLEPIGHLGHLSFHTIRYGIEEGFVTLLCSGRCVLTVQNTDHHIVYKLQTLRHQREGSIVDLGELGTTNFTAKLILDSLDTSIRLICNLFVVLIHLLDFLVHLRIIGQDVLEVVEHFDCIFFCDIFPYVTTSRICSSIGIHPSGCVIGIFLLALEILELLIIRTLLYSGIGQHLSCRSGYAIRGQSIHFAHIEAVGDNTFP